MHNAALPLQRLGAGEWNYLTRFLHPRDVHRLGQTCDGMRAVAQGLMRSVNDRSLARAIASSHTGAAFINSPPVACLRLAGNCGNAAAHLLSPAPHVNLLDLRGLKSTRAAEIVQLARLHPNARIILNAVQKTDLAIKLLATASDAIAQVTTNNTTHYTATHCPAQDNSESLQAIINALPANLLPTLALETATQSTRCPNEDSDDFNPALEEWETQRLALLASSLLSRCQREGLLNDTARLYLAIDGLRSFTWNVPVHRHKHLLLLSKLALALEGVRLHDSVTCHGMLSALAVAADTEFDFNSRPNRPKPVACKPHQDSVSPQQILATLISWGLDPLTRNSHGESVLDRLEARGLMQPADLLRRAAIDGMRAQSDRQLGARLLDLSQCAVS